MGAGLVGAVGLILCFVEWNCVLALNDFAGLLGDRSVVVGFWFWGGR